MVPPAAESETADRVVRNVIAFGRLLRRRGVPGGPGRDRHALEALGVVDSGRREDVFWALRSTLVSGADQLAVFDVAFAEFWEGDAAAPVSVVTDEAPADADNDRRATDLEEHQDGVGSLLEHRHGTVCEPDDDAERGRHGGVSASALELLAGLDFRAYGEDEVRAARRVFERLARALPRRQSRRLVAASNGTHLDVRRTLRAAMRTEGHPVWRAWLRERDVPRRLVFLLDVSGSMRDYARPLLLFCQVAARTHHGVEAFTFGTRLTRLTPYLRGGDAESALARTARAVPDWAGGTRIGESLRSFNRDWARKGMGLGAVIIILSDGWERGDVSLLAGELATLRRTCHRVVWVNPLAGDADYKPLAAGMAAALPHVDVFLPGHNLQAIGALSAALELL